MEILKKNKEDIKQFLINVSNGYEINDEQGMMFLQMDNKRICISEKLRSYLLDNKIIVLE